MKKILLSIAATAALTAAVAPAVAQPYGYQGRGGYGSSYDDGRGGGIDMGYYDSLSSKVQIAAQERRISWGEARALRNQLSQLHDAAWRVHTGEARNGERQRVDNVVRRAEAAINGGYGRGYGQRDRYDDRYDRNWGR